MEDVLKGSAGCQGVSETSEFVIQDELLRLVTGYHILHIAFEDTERFHHRQHFTNLVALHTARELPGYALIITPTDVIRVLCFERSLPETGIPAP